MSKKEKIKEYDERHHFWRDKVLSQLGFSINFFITFGIALLIYLLDQRKNYNKLIINSENPIDYNFTFYLLCVLLISSSVIYGGIAIVSRLFDLRITSHILKIRKNILRKSGKKLPNKFPCTENFNISKEFLKLLFTEFRGIKEEDYDNYEKVKKEFLRMRTTTQKLGKLTWKSHNRQIILFFITILIYGIKLIIYK